MFARNFTVVVDERDPGQVLGLKRRNRQQTQEKTHTGSFCKKRPEYGNKIPRKTEIILPFTDAFARYSLRTSFANGKRGALKANALAQQTQLLMLLYQVNPHFLFNALNSIKSLIAEDTNKARAMVSDMAEFMR
jgi:hypothetical protein